MDNIDINFEKEALEFIVDKSIEFKLGARGLRSIMEAILTDAMFELPSQNDTKEFNVNLAYAEKKFSKTSIARLKVA